MCLLLIGKKQEGEGWVTRDVFILEENANSLQRLVAAHLPAACEPAVYSLASPGGWAF